MDIKINEEIPRTMTLEGLRFLGELARHVPKNGVIVEVGPLFGSSTWVLAQNAHPSVTVYSLDTWEPAAWIDRFTAKKFPNAKPFSKKTFEYYVRDCPNVVPIQGWSPDSVADTWDKKIDLFFDDASHGNPGFINNINFFEPFVKAESVMCGDDYASGSPDIVRETDLLGKGWKQDVNVIGRVWALRKPKGKKKTTVYSELKAHKGPHPMLSVNNTSGPAKGDYPGAWVGRMHRYDPMEDFKVSWKNKIAGLDIVAQCQGMDGESSEWIATGKKVCPPNPYQPISSIRFMLTGEKADDYELKYQVGYCYTSVGRLSGSYNSKFFSGQVWSGQPNENALLPINAIRLILEKK